MAKSFSFNGIDLSTYGLTVRRHNLHDFTQETEYYQLKNKAVAGETIRPARQIVIDAVIEAADYAGLCSYMDSIRGVLGLPADAVLKMDSITDRYWMARCNALPEADNGATYWEGTLTFTAGDPSAYDNSETTGNHTIDEDPENFNEVVGGTAETWPVYTLTADDTASEVTITNNTTDEELVITIAMVATDVLEIDTETMIVKLNGTEDMSGVSGPFPRLLPGTNAFTVTGFSGTMATVYRKKYS